MMRFFTVKSYKVKRLQGKDTMAVRDTESKGNTQCVEKG